MKKTIITFLILILIPSIILIIFLLQKTDANKTTGILLKNNIPEFQAISLTNDKEVITNLDISNKISLINFFASWCIPCKIEHSLFLQFKKRFPNITMIGINHKDNKKNAIDFINTDGNPYDFIGVDFDGLIALEFGVLGLPETFLTDDSGIIIYKHIGPISNEIIENEIMPLL